MSEKTEIQNNIEELIKKLEQPMLNEEGLPFVEIMEREDLEPSVSNSVNGILEKFDKSSTKASTLLPIEDNTSSDSKVAPIPIVREIKENFISTDSAFLEYLRRMEQEANEEDIGVFEYPEWITQSIFGEEMDSDTEDDTASLTTLEDDHSPVTAEYNENIGIANNKESPLDITIVPSDILDLKMDYKTLSHEPKKVRFSNIDDVREFHIEEEHSEPKTRHELGISKFKARRMGLHDEE